MLFLLPSSHYAPYFTLLCCLTQFSEKNICVGCDKACSACFGRASAQCTQCQAGFYLLGSTCGTTCPDGMWARNDTRTCEPCGTGCRTCAYGAPSSCTTCLPGLYMLATTCNAVCPAGYFNQNLTVVSPAAVCTGCSAGSFCQAGTSHSCPTSTYQPSSTASACVSCPALSSHALTGQSSVTACVCQAGYALDAASAVCRDVDECAVGTARCDAALAACTNTVGSFTCQCNAGYKGDGFTCSPGGTVQLADGFGEVVAGEATATVAVQVVFAALAPAAVRFRTSSGTAISGTDFEEATGQLVYAGPGDSAVKTITIGLLDDADPEANEDFFVELYAASGSVLLGARNVSHVVIPANDNANGE
jgi:hypothetical protein